jgi:hypothetical protein
MDLVRAPHLVGFKLESIHDNDAGKPTRSPKRFWSASIASRTSGRRR